MKLHFSILATSLVLSSFVQAGWFWDLKVTLRSGIGCASKPCTQSYKTPDKVTHKKISLTFDDGPSSSLTPKILEILDRHEIKATFFVLGKNVKGNEKLLKSMVEQGHIIASHTWSHPSVWATNAQTVKAEIENTEKALTKIGIKPVFFRFPNGNSTEYSTKLLKSKGYKIVGWDVDTCDWGFNTDGVLPAGTNQICNGVNADVNDAQSYLLKRITSRNGGIILMHDTQKTTADNLDAVITDLKYQGYEFVLINDQEVFPLLNQ